jgi:hypothetical protein
MVALTADGVIELAGGADYHRSTQKNCVNKGKT